MHQEPWWLACVLSWTFRLSLPYFYTTQCQKLQNMSDAVNNTDRPMPHRWWRRSTLIEFHHHAGRDNIDHTLIIVCIPDGVCVTIQRRPCAPVKPPPVLSVVAMSRTVVVVLIRCGKLHPVASPCWMNGSAKSITYISAESRHTQTVLVSLWTQREWWILHRVPESSVSLDLKTHLMRVCGFVFNDT